MVTIGALWLPILLSSIAVWMASALFWMVSPHHKSDYVRFPDEEGGPSGSGSPEARSRPVQHPILRLCERSRGPGDGQ